MLCKLNSAVLYEHNNKQHHEKNKKHDHMEANVQTQCIHIIFFSIKQS